MTLRLIAAFVGVSALMIGALVIPLGLNFQSSRQDDLAASVERDAFVLASLSRESVARGDGRARLAIEEIGRRYQAQTGARVVVTGARGGVLFDSDPPEPGPRNFRSRPEIASALQGTVARDRRFSSTLGQELQVVAVPVASEGRVFGAVRVSFATDQVQAEVRDYWLRLGGLALVMLAATAAVGAVLARWATAPLRRLTEATEEFGPGRLERRADADDGPPEIRRLAASFNRMSERVQGLIESQDRFVADASHQLRTPLAAMTLQLDNLAIDAADPDVERRVDGLIAEAARLSAIIDGLLVLARAGSGEPDLVQEDVAEALGASRDRLADHAAAAGVALRVAGAAGRVATVEGALAQMVDNLVDNAIRATPSGGAVVLSSSVGEDVVEILVEDDGPGMGAEERERAFDRFRTGSGGSGLGLSVVRRLAEASGGDARLGARPGGGTSAVIRLPRPAA